MNGKDWLIVWFSVIAFYVVTFYLWTHHRAIAQGFFFSLFVLGMGVFAWGSWLVLKPLMRK